MPSLRFSLLLVLIFAAAGACHAQDTCSARCPNGSMSETYRCSSNYVPACYRSPASSNGASRTYSPPVPPPPDPAIALTKEGDIAFEKGDWDTAISRYQSAITLHPSDAALLTRLTNARKARQMEIDARADQAQSSALLAFQQRIDDQLHASQLQAVLDHANDDSTAAALNALYDNARNTSFANAEIVHVPSQTGPRVYFPLLRQSLPANTPAVKVLTKNQPAIRDLDKQIEQAKEALRRLIDSKSKSEAEREVWVKESEEATAASYDLSLSLFIDLLGARVDELTDINHDKREDVLNRLLLEAETTGPSKRIVSGYLSLVETKKYLAGLADEARLAGKENDLRVKIRDFDINKSESTLELAADILNQTKIADKVGPFKDVADAFYTIWRQAASLENLLIIQGGDEKTYQAEKVLNAYLKKLEAQKAQQKLATTSPH